MVRESDKRIIIDYLLHFFFFIAPRMIIILISMIFVKLRKAVYTFGNYETSYDFVIQKFPAFIGSNLSWELYSSETRANILT